jgi:hypothetical protein
LKRIPQLTRRKTTSQQAVTDLKSPVAGVMRAAGTLCNR